MNFFQAIECSDLKGLGGFQNFKKSIFFFRLFNNTICLEYCTIWCWNRRLYVC